MRTARDLLHWGMWLLALAILAALPQVVSNSSVYLAIDLLIASLFAMSFNLLLGQTGMLSFGHAAFYGLGCYGMALLQLKLGLPFAAAVVVSPFVAAAFAFLVALLTVHRSGMYFGMLTLAFGQLIFSIVANWYSFTGGDNGITVPIPDALLQPTAFYYFVMSITFFSILAMRIISSSPWGAALEAIRENPERAAFIGLNVRFYKISVFVISGAFAGLAGVLRGSYQQMAVPAYLFWTQSADPLLMTLVGGIHFFFGPVIGAVFFTGISYLTSSYAQYPFLILGVIVLIVVLFFPDGIGGTLSKLGRSRRSPAEDKSAPARSDKPLVPTAVEDRA